MIQGFLENTGVINKNLLSKSDFGLFPNRDWWDSAANGNYLNRSIWRILMNPQTPSIEWNINKKIDVSADMN